MPEMLKTRSGRLIELHSEEEDAVINIGAAQDPDNPELTDDDFARMRPAREVLPELVAAGIVNAELAGALLKPRGRPKAAVVKERISLRVSPDVLAYFKAAGDGWQTRMNDALHDWVQSRRT